MMLDRTQKFIRVVVFDDEPGLLLEAVRAIQEDLAQSENIQITVQPYRMDWLWQAKAEIDEYVNRIPSLWLIDLHQRFDLPPEVRESTQSEIDDFGADLGGTIMDLLRAARDPKVASGLRGQSIAPDGAVIIAKARKRKIPFFIASKYSQMERTAPHLSKLATGLVTSNADDWELRKSAGTIDSRSLQKLKARIAALAKPLASPGLGPYNELLAQFTGGWRSILKSKAESQATIILSSIAIIAVVSTVIGAVLLTSYVRKHWDFIEPTHLVVVSSIGIVLFIIVLLLGWRFDARRWSRRLKNFISNVLYRRKIKVIARVEKNLIPSPSVNDQKQ